MVTFPRTTHFLTTAQQHPPSTVLENLTKGRMNRCLFVLVLLWLNNNLFDGDVSVVNAKEPSEDNNNNNIQEKYLYHTEEARGIIIDYEPPQSTTSTKDKGDSNNKDDPNLYRPDFIYGPNQGPRVVEFYAPWCPHVRVLFCAYCIHLLSASHYFVFDYQLLCVSMLLL